MAKSRGFGDDLEKVLKATGVSALVEKTTELLGIEDCGCSRRRDWMNELIPYGTIPHIEEDLTLDPTDFAPGIYIVLDNLIIERNNRVYEYNKGNRILINSKNPLIEDFKRLFSIGIIRKE